MLVDGHGPAFRVAAPEGIDVNRQHGLQGAVLGVAYLEREAQQHVDAVGLELVALEREQHPLPPRRVEPGIEPHVVADEDAVQRDAPVPPLQQVLQLHIPQVRLKAQVVVRGVGHRVSARAVAEGVPRVATGTAGTVLHGA